MSRLRGAALFLLLALLFLAANRAAYKGWFMDDDLDNLAWTIHHAPAQFAAGLVSPFFAEFNYRPAGHMIYHWLGTTVGLEYGWYVAVMHALHLLNVWLVWLLARRLGAGLRGAGAGALLFAFHMACFDAYWKPMFVFDVVAAAFYLLALLAYLSPRWWLALPLFWLSYKGKELAVTLPAVLLLYEFTLGGRRWKRVLPFAAIALSFTVQGVLKNAAIDNDYSLRFTPRAVWATLSFYASKILLLPWAGLALIPAAWLVKDARARFALMAVPLMLGPLWFLPGRMFAVYLYLPLAALAVALAFASERWRAWVLPVFFLAWIPWNYQLLREGRKAALTTGPENRQYVEQLGEFSKKYPELRAILFDGGPAGMNEWGLAGAARWHYRRPGLQLAAIGSGQARALLDEPHVAVLGWDRVRRRLITAVRSEHEPDAAYIAMTEGLRAWQFGSGWFPLEGGFRWMGQSASVRLRRPAGATVFELRANPGPSPGGVELWIGGELHGVRWWDHDGWETRQWPLQPSGEDRTVQVELRATRTFQPSATDTRTLGAAVAAVGFVAP